MKVFIRAPDLHRPASLHSRLIWYGVLQTIFSDLPWCVFLLTVLGLNLTFNFNYSSSTHPRSRAHSFRYRMAFCSYLVHVVFIPPLTQLQPELLDATASQRAVMRSYLEI